MSLEWKLEGLFKGVYDLFSNPACNVDVFSILNLGICGGSYCFVNNISYSNDSEEDAERLCSYEAL